MTERPTEQTHPRLTGLDSPTPASSAQSNAQSNTPSNTRAPILPPMPSTQSDGADHHPQTSSASDRPSLAERLQEKLSSVRQAERLTDRPDARPDTGSANRVDQTSVRPAVQASTATSEAPPAPAYERPVMPPSADDQPPPKPAQQPARKRAARPSRPKRPPRRARLRLTRIDPWSVMKTAFLLSIALGVVTIVSVLMVWSVLGAAGVWDSINTTVRDIVGDQASTPFTIQDYLGTDRVIGFTMLVAVIDVVLLTALATLAAFLYNMAAALLGGLDITLVEDEH